MLTGISRYGMRVPPDGDRIIDECWRRGRLIRGPEIAAFERAFAARLGGGVAISTSYGRMAFYHILKALQLPPGSEIIVPALTFWVIPELARVAGLKVVFADVDPNTFTLDPRAFEAAITPRTRAVVPTHLYGLPCDMHAVLEIARHYHLAVVEDCAHALGASYRGQPVGTFGDAAFFSFQTLKPLNACGGGMALVRDAGVARRVAEEVEMLPWPSEARVRKCLRLGALQHVFTRPAVFTATAFPILWAASWFVANPDVYLWEPIRHLSPLPAGYIERFSNVQAALGLAGLEKLDEWTAATRAHARAMDAILAGVPNVQTPDVPDGYGHVYYQYCIYTLERDEVVRRCIRRGVDLESLHVDVCTRLPLFAEARAPSPGADRAAEAIQVPVYASLTDHQVERIGQTVRRALQRQRGATFAANRGTVDDGGIL